MPLHTVTNHYISIHFSLRCTTWCASVMMCTVLYQVLLYIFLRYSSTPELSYWGLSCDHGLDFWRWDNVRTTTRRTSSYTTYIVTLLYRALQSVAFQHISPTLRFDTYCSRSTVAAIGLQQSYNGICSRTVELQLPPWKLPQTYCSAGRERERARGWSDWGRTHIVDCLFHRRRGVENVRCWNRHLCSCTFLCHPERFWSTNTKRAENEIDKKGPQGNE